MHGATGKIWFGWSLAVFTTAYRLLKSCLRKCLKRLKKVLRCQLQTLKICLQTHEAAGYNPNIARATNRSFQMLFILFFERSFETIAVRLKFLFYLFSFTGI